MSEIAKTWTANGSCLLCVPKGMASKFNILDSNVVLEDTKDGIHFTMKMTSQQDLAVGWSYCMWCGEKLS